MNACSDGATTESVPELPPVPFQPPLIVPRAPGEPRGRPRPVGPGPAAQADRLGPVFANLEAALAAERLSMTDQPEAAAPEYVLVLEIAGELDDFIAVVRRVDGLEYLAEELGDKFEDVDTFALEDHEGKRTPVRRELFVVATNEKAAQELHSLWEDWQAGKRLKRNFGLWRTVFERLSSVRRWDDSDRLTRTGAVERWLEELADRGDEPIPFEVELWYRAEPGRRDQEQRQLADDLAQHGGRIIDDFVLPEIAYHGVVAELPASALVESAETLHVSWLSGNGVRFLRAVGQATVEIDPDPEVQPAPPPSARPVQRSARAALLDGIPLAGHALLDGRIDLDDPDGWEETSEVRHRRHGTAMASAILHGDLAGDGDALAEPIYVRPIIRVDPRHSWVPAPQETMPVERLQVDLVHAAVVRMLAGDDPRAPDVRIINISFADRAQAFDRFVSPLARLLDFLAATYDVLFVVSAGNHDVELLLPHGITDQEEIESEVLGQLAREATLRRLLAPAEAANALTVGAAQQDAGDMPDDGRVNLIRTPGLAAALSSWGAGHARAIKPDLLAPGGREVFDATPVADGEPRVLRPSRLSRPPGVQVAAPGRRGELDSSTWICGTSPATALVTRAGVKTLQRLDELRAEWGDDMPGQEFDAVLVKALLVHGATWAGADDVLRKALADAGLSSNKEAIQRSLGYGLIRPDWPLIDDDYRVTAIYASRLADGHHVYRLPAPPALAGSTDWRRVTVTLAWLTPVNPMHRAYRRAALRVDATGSITLATERQEASNHAVGRGTVQHEMFEGRRASTYGDGADLEFTVTAGRPMGVVDDPVPYALVVTLETAQEVRLPIYAQVRERIRARAARVPVRGG